MSETFEEYCIKNNRDYSCQSSWEEKIFTDQQKKIDELEKKLAEAVKHIKQHCGDALICPELSCYHDMKDIKDTETFLKSLEEKEVER